MADLPEFRVHIRYKDQSSRKLDYDKFLLPGSFHISQLLLYLRNVNKIRSDIGLYVYDDQSRLLKTDSTILDLAKHSSSSTGVVSLFISEMGTFGHN